VYNAVQVELESNRSVRGGVELEVIGIAAVFGTEKFR
jgi:hypothetical protein